MQLHLPLQSTFPYPIIPSKTPYQPTSTLPTPYCLDRTTIPRLVQYPTLNSTRLTPLYPFEQPHQAHSLSDSPGFLAPALIQIHPTLQGPKYIIHCCAASLREWDGVDLVAYVGVCFR